MKGYAIILLLALLATPMAAAGSLDTGLQVEYYGVVDEFGFGFTGSPALGVADEYSPCPLAAAGSCTAYSVLADTTYGSTVSIDVYIDDMGRLLGFGFTSQDGEVLVVPDPPVPLGLPHPQPLDLGQVTFYFYLDGSPVSYYGPAQARLQVEGPRPVEASWESPQYNGSVSLQAYTITLEYYNLTWTTAIALTYAPDPGVILDLYIPDLAGFHKPTIYSMQPPPGMAWGETTTTGQQAEDTGGQAAGEDGGGQAPPAYSTGGSGGTGAPAEEGSSATLLALLGLLAVAGAGGALYYARARRPHTGQATPTPTPRGAGGAPPRTPSPSPPAPPGPPASRPWRGPGGAPEVESVIPGYRIISKLGEGGFSTVYLAEAGDGSRVALKVPRLGLGETVAGGLVDSFRREAETWAKLRHENIVRVVDYGSRPLPYIAMEYMEGGSLRSRLQGPLPLEEALRIARGVAEALSYAHHMGVIHRDVKPENVLFDSRGTPKLSDFGLAKVLLDSGSTSAAGSFKGTLLYAAPEQVDPQAYGAPDWRTDIWQYGALLYEMLTGRPPFQASNAVELINKIVSEEPQPPSKLNPGVPAWLDELVLRCLAKRKEERWRSMDLVIERLAQATRHPRGEEQASGGEG